MVQIQLRRGTAATWTSVNPTLAAGEIGLETDTQKIKIGDGTTAWTGLGYYNPTIADATSSVKGILKLTGDLGGTADSPTVPGLSNKANTSTTISTTAPLSGGGDLSSNRILSISQASTTTDGYLSSVDFITFNNKQNALGFTPENVANKDTDINLAANSDTLYPSQKAVKTYIDTGLAGKGGIIDVQSFTSSGTWTKPTGAKLVEVYLIGGSAGGGSGRTGAAGLALSGGGGGASPAIVHYTFYAADLSATETITVGAKGIGGAAITANDTDGIDGTAGGETAIGVGINTKLRTYTTAGGGGGKLAAAGAGGGSSIGATAFNTGQGSGGSSSSSGAIGSSGTNSSGFNTLGGASGGGISTSNIPGAGGIGSRWTSISVLPQTNGGANGTTSGSADAGAGVLSAMKIFGFALGTGGGGGAGATNRNGGNGGNGNGFSGGGGGGAARNGFASGKGGDGTDGLAIIITYS